MDQPATIVSYFPRRFFSSTIKSPRIVVLERRKTRFCLDPQDRDSLRYDDYLAETNVRLFHRPIFYVFTTKPRRNYTEVAKNSARFHVRFAIQTDSRANIFDTILFLNQRTTQTL